MSVSSQNPAGLSIRDEWMAEIGLACAEVDGGGTVERGMALLESAAVKALNDPELSLDEYSGLLELLTSQSQRIPDDSRLIAWGRKCFLPRIQPRLQPASITNFVARRRARRAGTRRARNRGRAV
jgi:hypothetical protein